MNGKYRWLCGHYKKGNNKKQQQNKQTNKQNKKHTHTHNISSTVLKQVNLTPLPTAQPATTFPHGTSSMSRIGRW